MKQEVQYSNIIDFLNRGVMGLQKSWTRPVVDGVASSLNLPQSETPEFGEFFEGFGISTIRLLYAFLMPSLESLTAIRPHCNLKASLQFSEQFSG